MNTRIPALLPGSILILVCLLCNSTRAQSVGCGLTVDAGPDLVVCQPGGSVTLQGQISPAPGGFSWSPALGNTLTPSVPVSGTQTYTLTALIPDQGTNLITNGDFGAGNTGFTSDYIYNPTNLWLEGRYAVTASPNLVHSNFPPCDDHTPGVGPMMLVNGAGTAGVDVWCQTITVVPGTTYEFSAWVGTIVPVSPAMLQFSINGVPLGSIFNASSAVCDWQQFAETWTAGAQTSAEICIVNQNTAFAGNDFALDDLFFSPVCEVEDQVTVSVVDLSIGPPATLSVGCGGNGVSINSNGPTGPAYTYQWTSPDGQILTSPTAPAITAGGAGTYILTLTYDDGQVQCSESAQTVVTVAGNPTATILSSGTLGCAGGLVSLQVSSNAGAGATYSWTTPDGQIVSSPAQPQISVNTPGTYAVEVTSAAGCTTTAQYTVTPGSTTINTQALADGPLVCGGAPVNLTALPTDAANTYTWLDPAGAPLGQSGPTVAVTQPGTYTVDVQTPGGCSGTATVTVSGGGSNLVAVIAPPDPIDCNQQPVLLDGSGSSSGPGITYGWTTASGLLGTTNGNQATAAIPGAYTLTVTDANGCSATATVAVVSSGGGNLTASIAPPATIGCDQVPVLLDGGGSSSGAGISYSWTTSNGTYDVINGNQATAATPGDYTLIISDADGCTAETTVTVVNGGGVPPATLTATGQLSCSQSSVSLNAAPTGGPYSYVWTNPLGQTLNATGATLNVWEFGTYTVAVTDAGSGCTGLATYYVPPADDLFTAAIQSDGGFDCANGTVTLAASPDAPGFSYAWADPTGTPLANTQTVDVSQPGTYSVVVSNPDCADTAVFLINSIGTAPSFTLAPPTLLTCAATTTTLQTTQAPDPDWTYEWTTVDGELTGGTTAPQATAAAPGNYTLTVTSTATGCTATESVAVAQSADLPLASIAAADTLTCSATSVSLDGGNSSAGANYQYAWGAMGAMATQFDLAPYPVSSPGDYYLIVTDTDNGCSDTTYATVAQSADLPAFTLPAAAPLTCATTSTTLLIDGLPNGNYGYTWTDASGTPLGTDSQLTVNTPGDYQLTVMAIASGCSSSESINVGSDTVAPGFDFNTPDSLLCGNTVSIGAQNLSGNALSFAWTDPFGAAVGGNAVSLDVSVGGEYTLTVTDAANGCSTTGTVSVPVADNTLQVQLAPTLQPGCGESCVSTTATALNASGAVSYSWQALSGNFCTPPNGAALEAEPGTYALLVTDATSGCTIADTLTVLDPPAVPAQAIDQPAPITCAHQSISLYPTGAPLPGVSYAWSTTDGNITSDPGLPVIQADAPGAYLLTLTNAAGCSSTSSTTVVEQYNYPTVEAGNAQQLTCATTDVTLAGNATANGPLAYTWTDAAGETLATTAALDVSSAGWYYLTVTTQDACTGVDSVEITLDAALPTVTLAPPATLTCTTLSLPLDATGTDNYPGLAYTWTGPNGPLPTGSDPLLQSAAAPGNYTLTVTDPSTGCTASATQTVMQDVAAPVLSLDLPADTLTCVRTSLPFTLTTTNLNGATAQYQTTQPPGQAAFLANAQFQSPGLYTVSATNPTNGCTDSLAALIHIDTLAPNVALDGADVLTCTAPVSTLQYSSTNAQADWTYIWQTPAGNEAAQSHLLPVDVAGSYGVLVTDTGNGCTGAAVLAITSDQSPPELFLATPEPLTCYLPERELTASTDLPADQLETAWSTAGGNLTGSAGLTATVDQAGEYGILLTDTNNGCTASASVYLAADQAPPLAEAGAMATLDCDGSAVTLSGSSDANTDRSYRWMSAGTTSGGALLTTLQSGTYRLLVTNTRNGCTATDSVIVRDLRPELLLATPLPPACAGELGALRVDTMLGGTPPYLYRLDDGPWGPLPLLDQLQAGSYDLSAQDSRGCELTEKLVLTAPLPVTAWLPEEHELTWGDSVDFNTLLNVADSTVATVTWTPATYLGRPADLRPVCTPAETTAYALRIETKAGCVATARSLVRVDRNPSVYIPNAFSPDRSGTNDRWFVQTSSPMVTRVRSAAVYSRWGERVYYAADLPPNDPGRGWDGRHRGAPLNAAVFVYVVEVELLDGSTEVLEGDLTLVR